ncbi:hypothetical protein QBC43DRAFT_313279 [Cladorrhinum sp. PSN259]|nr:hypothetical protein QBC43DRAFT_313279 [Cladorrhinum sp. PSN259]
MLKSKSAAGPKVKAKPKVAPRRPAPSSKPESAASTPAATSTPTTPYSKEDTPAESQPSPPPPPPSQGAATPAPEAEAESEPENTSPSEEPTSTIPAPSGIPAAQVEAKKAVVPTKEPNLEPKAPSKAGSKTSSAIQNTSTEDSDPTAIRNASLTPAPAPSAATDSSTSGAPAIEDTDPVALRNTSQSTVSTTPAANLDAPAASRRHALPTGPGATPTTEDVANIQPSIEEPAESSTAGPSRAKKPRQPRKRKADAAAETAGEEASGEATAAPAPKKRVYKKRAAPLPGEEGHVPAAPRARRGQKRKASTRNNGIEVAAQEDGENSAGEQQQDDQGEGRTTRKRSTRSSRSVRESTPEDAENMQIDVTEVKMADLIKDMHIGKKFSLHDELMARERAKRLKYKEQRKKAKGKDNAGEEDAVPSEEGQDEQDGTAAATSATGSASASTPAASAAVASRSGPTGETYQIINGEIVVDNTSLAVNVHERARAAAGEMEDLVENDFTHHITTQTYLRRALKPGQWDDISTNEFYRALSKFGTDFETISKLFPGMTRKHIKLKFNREERANPARIGSALVGEEKDLIDLEEYKSKAIACTKEGEAPLVFQPVAEINADIEREKAEFEARQKEIEDAKAEEDRKKKEELLASLEAAKQKQAGGKRKNKKSKAY